LFTISILFCVLLSFSFWFFFFSSRRRHTRCYRDWSSDVCSSDLGSQEGDLRLVVVAQVLAAVVVPVANAGRGPRAESAAVVAHRSEERRVGKEGRSRGSPEKSNKENNNEERNKDVEKEVLQLTTH